VTTLLARTLWTPDFEIDASDRCARYPDGEEVRFTPRQWHVLALLMDAAPRPVTRGRLAQEVFGDDVDDEDLDHLTVLIAQLRRKLEPEPGVPRYFPCLGAESYAFDPDGAGSPSRLPSPPEGHPGLAPQTDRDHVTGPRFRLVEHHDVARGRPIGRRCDPF